MRSWTSWKTAYRLGGIRRVLRLGGTFVHIVRHAGDDICVHGGFAVHFPHALVETLADAWHWTTCTPSRKRAPFRKVVSETSCRGVRPRRMLRAAEALPSSPRWPGAPHLASVFSISLARPSGGRPGTNRCHAKL